VTLLCAVTEHRAARGVEAPGALLKRGKSAAPSTYDWREERGSEANLAGIVAAFEVMPLEVALRRTFTSDAHAVTYVVCDSSGVPLSRQPRVNKGGLSWLLSQGYSVTVDHLHVDVDNPGKERWTEESIAAISIPSGAGIYLTRGGYHLLQPLDEPVPVTTVELYLAAWHEELRDLGISVDTQCKDWTRLFRQPNVRREGRPFASPLIDLSKMHPRVIVPKSPARRSREGLGGLRATPRLLSSSPSTASGGGLLRW
jgi:hypothetical protein